MRINPIYVVAALVGFYFLDLDWILGNKQKEYTWQEFRVNYLERGIVKHLTVIDKKFVRVFIHGQPNS